MHLRMFDFMLRMDAFFQFTPLCRQMNGALKILHGFTDNVICERRAELQRNDATADDRLAGDEVLGTKRKQAFLDILLQASIDERPLTNLEIREEVDTFMFEVGQRYEDAAKDSLSHH